MHGIFILNIRVDDLLTSCECFVYGLWSVTSNMYIDQVF